MVETGVTKALYKIELYLIKIIPYIIATCCLLNTILSYFSIDFVIFSTFGGISILTAVFLIISSFVFKFCIYHRIPIYYTIVSNIISYIDCTIGIPVSNRELFTVYLALTDISMLLFIYLKVKVCTKH